MTVKELKEHLDNYSEDAVVVTDEPRCTCCYSNQDIELTESDFTVRLAGHIEYLILNPAIRR